MREKEPEDRKEGRKRGGREEIKNYSNWAELMTLHRAIQMEEVGGLQQREPSPGKIPHPTPLYLSKPSCL